MWLLLIPRHQLNLIQTCICQNAELHIDYIFNHIFGHLELSISWQKRICYIEYKN